MVRISGTTKLAGVIGHPLRHTLSPAMHNAVYEHMGLDWVYVPLHVEDEVGLRRLLAAARSMEFVGFNVTMPFKKLALELCDEVATVAAMAGAVNTVHCARGTLIGYNTDGRGLLESLESDASFVPEGARVAVIGSGGAAGAALVSLMLARVASISVVNRTLENAEELLSRMRAHCGPTRLAAVALADGRDAVSAADLVLNCTPLGMREGDPSPVAADWLREGQIVYDMVYGGGPTELVKSARKVGARAHDGLGMLVAQGAIAVDIWNEGSDIKAPRDVMRAAAEAQSASRQSS